MSDNILVLNRKSHGCQTCVKRHQCLAFELAGVNPEAVEQVSQKTTRAGHKVFESGQEFDGIYFIRSGFFKSYSIDSEGEMQVTGFHFPGELFGLDGIETGRYGNTVEALDTGSLCRIPLGLLSDDRVITRDSAPRQQVMNRMMLTLVRTMSRAISRDHHQIFALGKMSARRRFADFLLDVAQRMESSGFDRNNMRLCMSRIDIANYLGLAVETVSRLFTLFQASGILQVNRRELRIFDKGALQALVRGEAGCEVLLDKAG